jgi:hypothetical protein
MLKPGIHYARGSLESLNPSRSLGHSLLSSLQLSTDTVGNFGRSITEQY